MTTTFTFDAATALSSSESLSGFQSKSVGGATHPFAPAICAGNRLLVGGDGNVGALGSALSRLSCRLTSRLGGLLG